MKRIKFYLEKFYFTSYFIWHGLWGMAWAECRMRYQELEDARTRLPEIEKEGLERLRKAIEEADKRV